MDSLVKHLNELGFDASIRGGDSIMNIEMIKQAWEEQKEIPQRACPPCAHAFAL